MKKSVLACMLVLAGLAACGGAQRPEKKKPNVVQVATRGYALTVPEGWTWQLGMPSTVIGVPCDVRLLDSAAGAEICVAALPADSQPYLPVELAPIMMQRLEENGFTDADVRMDAVRQRMTFAGTRTEEMLHPGKKELTRSRFLRQAHPNESEIAIAMFAVAPASSSKALDAATFAIADSVTASIAAPTAP